MNGNEGSLIRAIRGPITLITVGVLFALNNFTAYRFHQTWPVLLIVFGLLSLLRRGTDPMPTGPGRQNFPPPPPAGPYGFPPPDPSVSSYRQSSYTGTSTPPPPEPAKGGFGTTAPPKSDSGPTPGDSL
jgi:LiaI-LiaF-like transmembrane region